MLVRYLFILIFYFGITSVIYAQATNPNGGDNCDIAIGFSSSFLIGCPSSPGQNFITNNLTPALQVAAPSCAVAANSGYDQWFRFTASNTTGVLIVNPQTSLNIVIEIFSGTCGSLTSMACVNIAGNNQPETLNVVGMTINTVYYFRIFGAANSNANRFGTYDFCGTTGGVIPIVAFPANEIQLTSKEIYNGNIILQMPAQTKEYTGIIERSIDGTTFSNLQTVYIESNSLFSWIDTNPLYKNYYRIKLIDISGNISYTKVIYVAPINKSNIDITYRSDIQKIIIHTNISNSDIFLQLIDLTGKIWYKYKLVNETYYEVSTSEMPSGLYIIQYTDYINTHYNKIQISTY